MLKRNKKTEIDKSSAFATITEPKSTAPLPSPVSSKEKTTIGEHIAIEGKIRGGENLQIEGSMKGNIELEKHNFTIGSKGRVEGEILAQDVSISGQLKGNIKALGKVEVNKEADFYGEIKAKSISVEDGAYFKGMIELDRESHRKSAFTETPENTSPVMPGKEKVMSPAGAQKEK